MFEDIVFVDKKLIVGLVEYVVEISKILMFEFFGLIDVVIVIFMF